jgi:hypothetical protein
VFLHELDEDEFHLRPLELLRRARGDGDDVEPGPICSLFSRNDSRSIRFHRLRRTAVQTFRGTLTVNREKGSVLGFTWIRKNFAWSRRPVL